MNSPHNTKPMTRPGSEDPKYDRRVLLAGAKRNAVLELWEVERYGAGRNGDPDYVSIYGMRPAELYAKGVRLLGRTAVECTRDELADAIGKDLAGVALPAMPTARALVLDLFVGSGNTLYWILRHLPGIRGVGFELDPTVFRLTARNLAILELPLEVANTDYRTGLADKAVAANQILITFISPPWGDALSEASGLDLRRTTPPVGEIVDFLARRFGRNRLLCAIQVYERLDPASPDDLKARFDWSRLEIYRLNAPGENHGVLLGTRGWTP